jgi:catechol 2,3-dioxygenase-like lactoylglutathione lyase family enzyme
MNLTLSMFELVAADMPTTLAFYRRLGLDIPESADTEMHVDVPLPGGLHLVFDTEAVLAQVDPSWTKPSGGHRVALAFACDSPAGVDDAYAELTGAGYEGHLAPWDAFWGMRYAVVHDPDGTAVDLFAELPAS